MLEESRQCVSDMGAETSTCTRRIRKVKKPMIEKKRRDRINQSLVTLKHILLDNIKRHGGTQTSKLDKADILEMTVDTLRMVARGSSAVTLSSNVLYGAGYRTCSQETLRYVSENTLRTDPGFKSLAGRLEQFRQDSKCNREFPENDLRPLRILIPPPRELNAPMAATDASQYQGMVQQACSDEYVGDSDEEGDLAASPDNGVSEIWGHGSRSLGQGEADIWRPW